MELPHSLEILRCRGFQLGFKIVDYFVGYRMPHYLDGPGSIRRLGSFLAEKGINDVLVVTGAGMVRRGQVQPMLEGFDAGGIRYCLQTYTTTDPTSDEVEAGYQAYKTNGCRAIVALGGGSRIDCGKAIAAKAVHPRKTIAQLQGLLKVHWPTPPVIAIPTTSGAGSETTLAAVITDSETQRKAAINDPFLIPKYAVLDPVLTVDLPPFTTATTGMDALVHAVEAYTNQTYNTSVENRLAREAVRLIHGSLLTAFEDGTNLDARQNMQLGAFYAGRAFTRGCVGYAHAIGHTLGSLYGVPHGLAMAVLLPHVMRQFGSSVHKRLAELADICGMAGGSNAEKAEALLRWMEQANRKMGLPEKFDMIREEDIDQMITWARKEAHPLYPVPVIWTREDFRKLIQSIRS